MLTGAWGPRSMAAAGVGVIRRVLRRTPPVQSAEQLLCNSSRPISALTSSSSLTAKAIAVEGNELIIEAGEPVPRFVFGGVPSFEESKEATTELKEVLDGMYLSSPTYFESENSMIPGVSLSLNTEIVDYGSGVIMENNTSIPGPKHVHQALRLLSSISTIKDIIDSVSSDQKVLDAVLNNSDVKKFLLANQTSSDTFDFEDEAKVTQQGESGAGVMGKLRSLNNFIIKMVTSMPIHSPEAWGPRSMAAAGVGVIRGVLRRTPPVQSAEQLLCNSSRPISAPTSSSSLTAKAIAVEGNELIIETGEPVPRFVFGGVPSFEESKEATTELKEVLDGMYLSSPTYFESENSMIPGVSLSLNTEIVDYGSGVIMENNTSIPGPKHVHQALHLLSSISTIKDIIDSASSDQKVLDAVLNNSDVKKFLLANQTSSDTSDFEDEAKVTQQEESGAGVMGKLRSLKDFIIKMVTSMPIHSPELFGSSSVESASGSDHKENINVKACKSGSGFVAKLRNLKNSVVEMATNIPKYFPNLSGSSAAESVSGSDHQGNTQSSPPELSLGTSLTGLAIMVIMIVVFKRV